MTVKKILFAIMILTAFSACAQKVTTLAAAYVIPTAADAKKMEQDIFSYINEYRNSIGLSSLQLSKEATTEAVNHSSDMAYKKTPFGHEGFNARMDNIIKTVGFIHASAENVAAGYLSAKQVVDGWLNSPGHKKNIEGDYKLTGIGVVTDGEGRLFFTQIFLRP